MSFDSLTWSAIIIIFIILLATIWIVHRSNQEHRGNIRRFAKQQALMLSSDDAIKLCRAIRKIHPEACPGLDYSINVASNGDAEVAEWKHAQQVPSREQLREAIALLEKSDK